MFIFLGTIFFDVGKKYPKIILENYAYTVHKKMQNKTLWICPGYYKTKCKCKITTTGRMVQISGEHNHGPNNDGTKFKNMLSQVVSIVRTNKTFL